MIVHRRGFHDGSLTGVTVQAMENVTRVVVIVTVRWWVWVMQGFIREDGMSTSACRLYSNADSA